MFRGGRCFGRVFAMKIEGEFRDSFEGSSCPANDALVTAR